MILSKSRSCVAWLNYFSLCLFGLLLALASAGAIYQRIEYSRDRRMNPPSGQLVDVGGYRMHVDCVGDGSPTVVLDSGLSDSSLSWYKVQPQVAQFTRVCSYDRAGLGWSEPSLSPRNSGVFAGELHTLLHNAKIDGPFVLVGHSMGGYDVRIFASRFPSDVVGLVLVDSAHPDLADRIPELRSGLATWRRQLRRQELLMPFGVPRLMGWCGNGPPELQAKLRTIECNATRLREAISECYSMWDESAAQARTGPLGNLPLIVISEDPKHVIGPLDPFEEGQQSLARLSSNSVQMTAIGSGHQIQRERPDIVISAIELLVEQNKHSLHNF